jgi:hypothetical protein
MNVQTGEKALQYGDHISILLAIYSCDIIYYQIPSVVWVLFMVTNVDIKAM